MKWIYRLGLAVLLFFPIINLAGQGYKGEDSLLVILTAGLPPDDLHLNAQDVVAKKWGLKFKSISGCLVSEEILDSLENNNDKVFPLVDEKYGVDWQDKFYEEVEMEKAQQIIGLNLISKSEFIEINAKELIEEGHCCMYRLLSRVEDENYHGLIIGWEGSIYDSEAIIYYQLVVNINEETIELVTDEQISLEDYYKNRELKFNKR